MSMLNAYMQLAFVSAMFIVLALFVLPLVIFIIGIMGVMITVTFYIAVTKISDKSYYLTIRIWEKRFGSYIIKKVVKAKEVRDKKGNLWYELMNGKRIKRRDDDDKRKIKGWANRDYIDIVLLGNDDYIPLEFDLSKDEDNVKIVPEDMREFLADSVIYATEQSMKPKNNLEKLMPLLQATTIGISGVIMAFMLVIFMQQYPAYAAQMQAQTHVLDAQIQMSYNLLDNICQKYPAMCSNIQEQNLGPPQNFTVT